MKVKLLHPLLSCICVTSKRPDLLLKSILSFDQQNYPNKELIISYPKNDHDTKELIEQVRAITDIIVVVVERDEHISLGLARNEAARLCNGDYICIWDDDDIYHFRRLSEQYNLLQGSGRYFQSSIIKQIILFDATIQKAYLSFENYWNSTLLCKTNHFLEHPCNDTNRFECQPVINYLLQDNLLLQSNLSPYLYTAVYHGSNVIDYYHFKYYVKKGMLLDEELAQSLHAQWEQKIKLMIS